jgi:hypothetical protein
MPKVAEARLAAWALAACVLTLSPAARAFQPGTPAPERDPEIALQKRAVADIRNVGTAMFSWLTDQVTDEGELPAVESGEAAPCDCPEPGEKAEAKAELNKDYFETGNIPLISWKALRAILVPQYLHELPKNDPWGNPYEYRLKVQNLLDRTIMSIRSAGSDGRLDAEEYRISGFLPADVYEDLVWADGFFVRWPETPKPEKAPVKK